MRQGTLQQGTAVALSSNDNMIPGVLYEARGQVAAWTMAALPLNWVEWLIGKIYETRDARFDVQGVELWDDGAFRIQFTVKGVAFASMGTAFVVIGGLLIVILAGMKLEQIYRLVVGDSDQPGGKKPPGTIASGLQLVGFVALAVVGVFVYKSYKGRAA